MLSLLPFEALALALGFLPAALALGFLSAALVFLLAALLFALALGGLGASTTGGFFGALLLLEPLFVALPVVASGLRLVSVEECVVVGCPSISTVRSSLTIKVSEVSAY